MIGFEIHAKGEASSEAQVRYLAKVIQIKDQEIRDLTLEMKTLKMETQIEGNKLFHQIQTLDQVRKDILAQRKILEQPLVKKKWWKFIKNETRN